MDSLSIAYRYPVNEFVRALYKCQDGDVQKRIDGHATTEIVFNIAPLVNQLHNDPLWKGLFKFCPLV